MKIIMDAMGGDASPKAQLEGAMRAVRELGIEVCLVGDSDLIMGHLDAMGETLPEGLTVQHASQVITNDEDPAFALRRKKDASIVVAANMLKNGDGDALVSTGSTGGVLCAGLLLIGRIKGVQRPALAPVYPTETGYGVLIDCGANADCKPQYLAQFGVMGSIYASAVLGKKNAKVALINNGAEEHKGSTLYKEAHQLLKQAPINFIGNIEGRDVMSGTADVVVCDGFTGNVMLKVIEGVSSTLLKNVKGAMMSSLKTKIGALLAKDAFKTLKKKMDYSEHGGALLLGTKYPVIKGHGSSDAKAVFSAIRQATKIVEADVVCKIAADIEKMEMPEA
ncbi:MAG: phosphate acyltransferase PlsX [Clostridia bacterium]|nr:phosphate acyltransferase PlsX [Clostridia bacterium]